MRLIQILLSTAVFASANAYADKAEVVFYKSGCDYFIAEGLKGYYLLEWHGGYDPSDGDTIIGEISRYGFKKVYYPRQQREGKLYVEDYDLSKDSAIEKWIDKCR